MGATDWTFTVGTHLLWGVQPVLARYLQTVCEVNRWSAICVTQSMSGTVVCLKTVLMRKASTTTSPSVWSPTWRALVFLTFGCIAACRMTTNFASAGLTSAWHISAVAMFGPFLTVAVSRVAIGERIELRSWPSVICAVFGGFLVATGESGSGDPDSSSRRAALAGCALQVVSLCFSAAARVVMKTTAGEIGAAELMSAQYLVVVVVSFLATTSDLPNAWTPWTRSSERKAWLVAFLLAFFIQFIAAAMQVHFVRTLGPAKYTCLQPLRAVSTVVFDYLILKEPVTSKISWLGLAIVAASVSSFLIIQAYSSQSANDVPNNSSTTPTKRYEPVRSQDEDYSDDEKAEIELSSRPHEDDEMEVHTNTSPTPATYSHSQGKEAAEKVLV